MRTNRLPVLLVVLCCSVAVGCAANGGSGEEPCGNGALDIGEQCDGSNIGGYDCGDVLVGTVGTLGCSVDCLLDTSGCQAPTCGDGIAASTEQCDGADLKGMVCDGLLPGSTGTLACSPSCTIDTTGCSFAAVCGNDVIEGTEQCDGIDLGTATCPSVVPGSTGTLGCLAGCTFDTSGCLTATCGNGVIEGSEECDLAELGTATCDSVLGAGATGTLACDGSCAFDTTACVVPGCGNGQIDGAEDCDGADLGSATCASVVGAGATGTLSCSGVCVFDTAACVYCGDGVRQFGEDCDCGTDALNLPVGCTDVNGGASANCSALCVKIPFCGDAVVDAGEDCDCGTDPLNLPAGCPDINGGAAATCSVSCTSSQICSMDLWEACNTAIVPDECCMDDWGRDTDCTQLNVSSAYCLRPCAGAMDCYWGNFCHAGLGNKCYPEVCSEDVALGWPNTTMNAACTVTGGGAGWCAPILSRNAFDDFFAGICVEAGTLAHGTTCPQVTIDTTDRSELMCDLGLCLVPTGQTTGTCAQFCDGDAAYDAIINGVGTDPNPCPAQSNCFSESVLDPATGLRQGDTAYCRPTSSADPANGFTTCSLITGELLSNPAQTCATAGFTNGRCVMVDFGTSGLTEGTRIGVCIDNAVGTVAAWDACTAGIDVCPAGTICEPEDVFGAATGATRCVPYCDTSYHDGVTSTCTAVGAPVTNVCRSISLLAPPSGPTDVKPSKLGYCALP